MAAPDPPEITPDNRPGNDPEIASGNTTETELDTDADAPDPIDAADDDESVLETVEADAESVPEKTPAKPRRRPKVILCPYCGHTQSPREKCVSCGGLFEPLSRRATQIAMGPWTVRSKAQPFRPGCSYEVLKKMIDAGHIGPTTVLRGPTTRQFWSIARNVPGVAHLLGYCHGCGKHVPKDGIDACPQCATPFKSVRQRNELGLQFPHRRAAEAAQRTLNRLIHGAAGPDGESAAGESAITAGLDTAGDSVVDAELTGEDQVALDQSAAPTPTTIFDDESFGSAAGLDVELEEEAVAETGANLIDDVLGGSLTTLDNPPVMDQAAAAPPAMPDPLPPIVTETSNHSAALPPRRDINWLVVALVVLNVLVAAAVVAFVATRGGEG